MHNTSRLPTQKVVLRVTKNKAQLIDLMCQNLIINKDECGQHTPVVTGSVPVPIKINTGVVIMLQDISITQEEGDTILIQQVESVGAPNSLVVADDTNICVLLLYSCHHGDIPFQVMIVSPIQGRAVIDINETIQKAYWHHTRPNTNTWHHWM